MSAVDFESFVERLATVAGEAILPFFRTSIGVEDKGRGHGFDPVTAADRAGEAAMRGLINETFPGHGIIGEEYGAERPDAEYVWVLDPIDGTRGFITGLPTWGTLIGLRRAGAPVFGLMSQPMVRERFLGDGGSARCRGPLGERALRTRACARLEDAVLTATSPQMFKGDDAALFLEIAGRARLTRYGADCYGYAMVAAGHIDLAIEAGLEPYDVAALIPIVEGAGGVITTWSGGPAVDGGKVVAAGDPRLHEAALEMLAKAGVA